MGVPEELPERRDGLLHHIINQPRVVAVHSHAWQAEAFSPLRNVFDGDGHLGRHRNRIAIVFADHYERNFPQCCHVQCFEERAFTGGAIAEENDHNAAVFAELVT